MERVRVGRLEVASLTFALAALMLVMGNSGCQQSTTASDRVDGEQASSADQATQLLEQMAATYKDAKTYEDAGELKLTASDENGEHQESPPIPFSVALERPNKVRIHSLGAVVVGDGQKLRATSESLENQILELPGADSLNPDVFLKDEMLDQSMRGELGLGLPQIALLLLEDPFKALADGEKPVQLEDASLEGETCHRVAVQGQDGTSIFWIDPQTHLLRKFEFPSEAFRKRNSLAKCSIWAEFKGAQLNRHIDADAFKMEIPDNVRLLSRFMPPPPDPRSPLLGELPAKFVFFDLNGEPVERDALEGKVVVLDMWATWCGYCFKGFPNLEEVYQKFKDNDKVVILAVNGDRPNVSDADVAASFEKAKLNIPIVRDTQDLNEKVFQVKVLPTMVVLGTDGSVQSYHVGYDKDLAQTLPKQIERLLAGENLAKEEIAKHDRLLEEYEEKLSEASIRTANASDADEPVGRK